MEASARSRPCRPAGRRPAARHRLAAAAAAVGAVLLCPRRAAPAAAPLPPAGAVGDFAREGPLYARLRDPPPPEEWAHHGAALLRKLSEPELAAALPADLPTSLAVRVYHLYLPIYFWMRALVGDVRTSRQSADGAAATGGATVVGLSAPQGCGKTTLVELLVDRFAADGLRCASVSIDDFYLTGADQDGVAQGNPENALLQVRGNAGTHDLSLGEATLRGLRDPSSAHVAVPSYDKAARSGRGDRAPASKWREEQTPLDVVLFEGWMAGFKPRQDEAALRTIHEGLPGIDSRLGAYQAWDDLVDGWCVLALIDRKYVFDWRLQAEHAMAAAGRPGMDDDAVRDFVARYMPAYEAYCPSLYAAAAAAGVDGKPSMLVHVDGTRSPVAQP